MRNTKSNVPSSSQANKSNLHYTLVITPKRVTSGGATSATYGLGNTALKKRRSRGERLVTLFLIRPARESNSQPTAPAAVSLTTVQPARSSSK